MLSMVAIIMRIRPNLVHLISPEAIILGGLVAKLLLVPKVIYSVSGLGSANYSNQAVSKTKTNFMNFLLFLSTRRKHAFFIFQNKSDLARIESIKYLRPQQRILLPGSGVDLGIYKVEQKVMYNDNAEVRVVMASRIIKEKGVEDYIKAIEIIRKRSAKDIPSLIFELYGRIDKERPNQITMSDLMRWEENGIIRYRGATSELNKVLNQTDIFVFPSFYGEGLPKVLCEAAACGVPVITTDHPGCREAIIPDTTGILVPKNSPEQIADAIEVLVKDPSLRNSFATNSRLMAVERFDVRNVVEQHMRIYSSMLSDNDHL